MWNYRNFLLFSGFCKTVLQNDTAEEKKNLFLTEFLENILYFGFALEVHLGLVLPDPRYIDWEGAVCQM